MSDVPVLLPRLGSSMEEAIFVEWLRAWNGDRPAARGAGFYGLDLYSLHASMEGVLRYLDQADPVAAARTRERYACFEAFGGDGQAYGLVSGRGAAPTCEEGAVATALELQRARIEATLKAVLRYEALETV